MKHWEIEEKEGEETAEAREKNPRMAPRRVGGMPTERRQILAYGEAPPDESGDLPAYGEAFAEEDDFALDCDMPPEEGREDAITARVKGVKRRSGWRIAGNILFYLLLVAIVFVAFFFSNNQSPDKSIFGYRVYSIQTSSMADVYPPGTMVFVKMLDGETTVSVGDDITFYASPTAVVTHRVTEVLHNYQGSGMTAYHTKGVNNQTEDADPVFEPNVVGKVAFSVKYLGGILEWVVERWWLVLILVILPFIIAKLVRYALKDRKNK